MRTLKLTLIAVLGYFIVACATDPVAGMTPGQIAQHYEYTTITPVEQIETRATFSFQYVNSKAVILDYGWGFEYLVTLRYSCFNLRSDSGIKTNSSDRMTLNTSNSLVVTASGSGEEYCQVDEIFKLEK